MKRRFFYLLPALLGIALFITGCGLLERPDSSPPEQKGPWTFLRGAGVQEAKSLAMGSAVTKGWKIKDASGNQFSVERPFDIADAEALVGAPVTAASVVVKTDFNPSQGGVEVVTKAAVIAETITAKGKKSEVSIDATDNRANQLHLSLAALQKSWQEAGWRIAAAHRPQPRREAKPENAGAASRPDATAEEETADAAVATPPPEAETTAPTAPSDTVPPPAPRVPDEPVAPAVSVVDRTLPTPPPVTPGAPPGGNEVVPGPNPPRETGVWAYYAEHAAKAQGCEQPPGGLILEARHSEFELYRVRCSNGYELLFRCSAGVCNVLQEN